MMLPRDWQDRHLDVLVRDPLVGYAKDGPPAAEPLAIAALAALGHDLPETAYAACAELQRCQHINGSVSVWLDDSGPYWPTSLACIAWQCFKRRYPERISASWQSNIDRGLQYLLSCGGVKNPIRDEIGHNTQLVGWPWVQGTHSWLEPTAMTLLALRHNGFEHHPRAVEAAHLLIDRQVPGGGANYGNTYVLGQKLVSHVMPSAMSLVALSHVTPRALSLVDSMAFLNQQCRFPMGAVSLAWSLHAMSTADADPAGEINPDNASDRWSALLRSAVRRMQVTGSQPHQNNWLLLASLLDRSPLLVRNEMSIPSITSLKTN
ncbi:MAG: hypothetical protein AAF745_06880 [Planctomycetota bacterium]